jgi:hypothetical protein
MPNVTDYRVLSRLVRLGHVPAASVDATVFRNAVIHNTGPKDPNGLLVRGLRIVGELDLDFATLDHPVRMTGVRIEGELGMTSLRAGDVTFVGSWMKDVRLAHARIDNDFAMEDCVIDGTVYARVASFGTLRMGWTRVSSLDRKETAITLDLANVDGDLDLVEVDVRGKLSAIGIDVRGSFLVSDARLGMPAPAPRRRSRVSSSGPQRTRRQPPPDDIVCLDSARIGGVLDFSNTAVRSSILARGAHVGGQAKFFDARVGTGFGARSRVLLDGIEIEHDALLDGIIASQVSIAGARVGGDLSFRRVRISHHDSVSVRLSDTTVREWAMFDASHLEGMLLLHGAVIGAALTAVPSGDLYKCVPRIEQVNLSRSKIGGDVILEAIIPQGLIVDRADLQGTLFLDRAVHIGPPPTVASTARAAVIGRNASIHHLRLGARDALDGPLDLSGARVGILDVGELVVGEDSWSVEPADRLPSIAPTQTMQIGSILGFVNDGWRHSAAWLSRAAAPASRKRNDASAKRSSRTFDIQPWMAIASVFESSGRESEARRLKYEATDRLFKHRSNWFSAGVWRTITKFTIGHGYYSQFALVWLAGLWLATTLVIAVNPAAFSPTDRAAAVEQPTVSSTTVLSAALSASGEVREKITTGSSHPTPAAYPAFSAPLYAVDIVVSPVGTGQSAAWWVSGDLWLSTLITLIKLTAWSLLGLFVTGISGILSKR